MAPRSLVAIANHFAGSGLVIGADGDSISSVLRFARSKKKRRPDESPRPGATTFDLARIEQNEVVPAHRRGIIPIGCVKIADLVGGIAIGFISRAPSLVRQIGFEIAGQLNLRGTIERHREITGQMVGVRSLPPNNPRSHLRRSPVVVFLAIEGAVHAQRFHGSVTDAAVPLGWAFVVR